MKKYCFDKKIVSMIARNDIKPLGHISISRKNSVKDDRERRNAGYLWGTISLIPVLYSKPKEQQQSFFQDHWTLLAVKKLV